MWQSCRSQIVFSSPDSVPGHCRIRRLLFGKKHHGRRKEQLAASNEVSLPSFSVSWSRLFTTVVATCLISQRAPLLTNETRISLFALLGRAKSEIRISLVSSRAISV